jgi:hypothetical protein
MKKKIWAQISHNVLLLKTFTLDYLELITGDKCEEVLLGLEQEGLVELKDGSYRLTLDIDKRFGLLARVREVEREMDELFGFLSVDELAGAIAAWREMEKRARIAGYVWVLAPVDALDHVAGMRAIGEDDE